MHSSEKGFTLIELLVVVIIIGVLGAIATPTFLSQANKARGAEARTNLGVINRAQTAHYVAESEFANDLDELRIGLQEKSDNYSYDVAGGESSASATATPNNDELNGYAGAVAIIDENQATDTVLCESDDPGVTPTIGADLTCPGDSEEVK